MANQTLKLSVCAKLTSEADIMLASIEKKKSSFEAQVESVKTMINNLKIGPGFRPQSVIQSYCNDLFKNINSMVPNLSQFDEVADIINKCSFLSNHPTMKHPSAIVKGVMGDLKSGANNVIRDLTGGLPDFEIGLSIKGLNGLVKTEKLDIVKDLKSALGCMGAICGTDITSRMNKLQNVLNACLIKIDGTFDINSLFTVCGMTPDEILSTETLNNAIDNIYSRIDSACDDAENAASGALEKIIDPVIQAEARASALYEKSMSLFEED